MAVADVPPLQANFRHFRMKLQAKGEVSHGKRLVFIPVSAGKEAGSVWQVECIAVPMKYG
jgi:hypothetical protein